MKMAVWASLVFFAATTAQMPSFAGNVIVGGKGNEVEILTFSKTGKIEDLEKLPEYNRGFNLALLLMGEIKSAQRQQIIEKYILSKPTEYQNKIYWRVLEHAVEENNAGLASEVMALATKTDSSQAANIFCGTVEEWARKADNMERTPTARPYIKKIFENLLPVAQKYKFMNQSCGKYGTIRDLYARHFPDLEAKLASNTIPKVLISDKKKYSQWRCTEAQIRHEIFLSLSQVLSQRKPNSGYIGIDTKTCFLLARISKNSSGAISFKADEHYMGFKLEIPKADTVDEIIGAMKKTKLLSPTGDPIVDEKQVLEANKENDNDQSKSVGGAMYSPFVERSAIKPSPQQRR